MSADSGTPLGWLSVTVQHDNGSVRLVAAGEIDMSTAGQLQDSLHAVLDDHPSPLVVDLAAVTFMDSSGLAVLAHAHNRPLRLAPR